MNIVLWIVQGLLATLYLLAGQMKAFTPHKARANAQMTWAHDKPDNYIRFVGVSELLGALGLILPLLTGILPWLTVVAAVGLAVIQALAIFTVHLPKKEYQVIPINIVLLILAVVVMFGRFNLFS
ncbi:MAG: DoxX family protein [Chloroflexi bacterium OLB14]|nr:MAG: DoxX family protein [Chloroflexi bacterium OLB14]